MGELIRIAGTADVKPGAGMVAEVNGKAIAVFNVDGAFMPSTIPVSTGAARWAKGMWKGMWCPAPGTTGSST